jgi:hypothetical protein
VEALPEKVLESQGPSGPKTQEACFLQNTPDGKHFMQNKRMSKISLSFIFHVDRII